MPLDPRTLERDAAVVAPPDPTAQRYLMQRAGELEDLEEEVGLIEETLKLKKERLVELRTRVIPELMEKAGLVNAKGKGSFTLRSGAKIHLKEDVHVNVLKENKPGLLAWLRRNKHGDLIKEDVHHSTLKAFVKERIEEDQPLPYGVTLYPETSVVFTRAKAPTKPTRRS